MCKIILKAYGFCWFEEILDKVHRDILWKVLQVKDENVVKSML